MKPHKIAFFAVCAALAAGLLLFKNSLSHKALAGVLQSSAPTTEAMSDFLATSRDPAVALRELWDTGKLPQRLHLFSALRQNPSLWSSAQPLALQATQFADSQIQEDALQLLSEHQHPAYQSALVSYLKAPDPQVRLAALQRLVPQKDRALVPDFALLLDDPDQQVQTLAAAGLRQITGQDFGTRLSADSDTHRAAIAQWKAWFAQHRSEFPAAPASSSVPPPRDDPAAIAFDFSLPDLTSKLHSLTEYKGKIVLLNFWATWCPTCITELDTLTHLQIDHPEIAVVGINVDGISDTDDHDPPPDAAAQAKIRQQIHVFASQNKIGYTTLLDPLGTAVGPFAAGNLPTNILISPDGKIARRLLGVRTQKTWEVLLASVKRSTNAPGKTTP